MIDAESLRVEARAVAEERLLRARGALSTLASEEREAIEEVAYAVALGVAEALAHEASRSRIVAAALQSPTRRGQTALRVADGEIAAVLPD